MEFKITLTGDKQVIAHFQRIISNFPKTIREEKMSLAREIIANLNEEVVMRSKWTHTGPPRLNDSFYASSMDANSVQVKSRFKYAMAVEQGVNHGWYEPNNPIWKAHGKVQKQHPPNKAMLFVTPAVQKTNPKTRAQVLARKLIK